VTYLELCQHLRRECGVSGSGPASVVDQTGEMRRLVEWIKAAWREIQLARPDWRFMWAAGSFTTSAGVADYTQAAIGVTATQFDLGSFVLTDGAGSKRALRHVPYTLWKATYGTATLDNAVPTLITDLPDQSLRLTVPPDDAYAVTFDYYREPQELAANTNEPYLPERYQMLIVYKAMMYYAGYEDAKEVLTDAILRYNPLFDALETSQLPPIGFGHTPLGDE
jgi:hypothetical protein